jgi:hypothetical protein
VWSLRRRQNQAGKEAQTRTRAKSKSHAQKENAVVMMSEPTEKELEEKAEGVFRATKAGMHLVAHGEATELLEMLDAKRDNNE